MFDFNSFWQIGAAIVALFAVGMLISYTIEVVSITIQTIKAELQKRKSELNGAIKAFVEQKRQQNGRNLVTLEMLDRLGNSKGKVKMGGQSCTVYEGQTIDIF